MPDSPRINLSRKYEVSANSSSTEPEKQPRQPGDNPRYIKVSGSDRIYDRNKILLVLLVPLMMSLLQVSSVNTALPAIEEVLGATPSQIQWILSGYALAIGICLVPAGRLGDIFGQSGAFVTGLGIFTVTSLLIGLMPNAELVNILRIFQGIGAGIYSPQVTGLIQQYFTGQARAKAFALFGLVISMSVAAGPLMSGALITWMGGNIGWRASFIINFPLGLIGLLLGFLWLPFGKERRTIGKKAPQVQADFLKTEKAEGRTHHPRTERPKIDLDPVGMVILVFAVLGIMLPFMVHGTPWFWAVLPVGFALLGVFVWWEARYLKRGNFPMVNLNMFKIRTFSYSTAISAVMFLGTTSVFVVLAMFLQDGLGVEALYVGLVTLSNAIMSAIFAVWAGRYAMTHGRLLQVIALAVMLVSILGYIGIAMLVKAGASYWLFAIPAGTMGFGQGIMGSANQTQSMLDIPPQHGGTAGGITQTAQRVTTAIGNAIITAVYLGMLIVHDYSADAYFHGFYFANLVVIVFVSISLILAILFLRDARRHPAA